MILLYFFAGLLIAGLTNGIWIKKTKRLLLLKTIVSVIAGLAIGWFMVMRFLFQAPD